MQDQAAVEIIREALWRDGEFGRAAVMVGSGFSRYARPKRSTSQTMPLWDDIVRALVNALYPIGQFSDQDRERIATRSMPTSGALRLAEQYEAEHGRQSLDELLLRSIPNDDYRPGLNHELLLGLPWADILTTNYDTLLEDCSRTLSERAYSIVRCVSDIPHAFRPRIVKLHGSFPSNRPFIITEEDFRRYHVRNSPFVNLSQQVFMEQVVCLLGFSGDDPNFLNWAGWVRDNLGTSTPRIYLCGVLDRMTNGERLVLRRLNVNPIDLSPVVPEVKIPRHDHRHRLSTEWFLRSLAIAEKSSPMTWPRPWSCIQTMSDSMVAPPLATREVSPFPEPFSP